MAEGPYRVGVVHQEEPRIGQIERAAQRRGISARTASTPRGRSHNRSRPPLLDADPAERRAGVLRTELGVAQEPPEVLIRAVEDVTADPLCDLAVDGGDSLGTAAGFN